MARKFDKNPNDRLKNNEQNSNTKETIPSQNKSKEENINPKVGRPKIKTEETKTINIAVPVSILEKLNVIKKCYENNLTKYINTLIEKDINVRYEEYKSISDSLNNLK